MGSAIITFDADKARERLTELGNEDEMPHIWMESPARSIDDVLCEYSDCIATPDDHMLLIYPLIYSGDADGIMIVVSRPRPAPMLAISLGWDDVVPGPRERFLDRQLTIEDVISIISTVVRYGNDLLTREASL